MHKDTMIAWSQLEIMMRTGVPHAMDIASELVRHDLQSPLPTHTPKLRIDLQFYNVIHRAYRSAILSRFLAVMALVKQTRFWDEIRSNQETQLAIMELCRESSRLSLHEATTLIMAHLTDAAAPLKDVA